MTPGASVEQGLSVVADSGVLDDFGEFGHVGLDSCGKLPWCAAHGFHAGIQKLLLHLGLV